jgi:hypothetical protein
MLMKELTHALLLQHSSRTKEFSTAGADEGEVKVGRLVSEIFVICSCESSGGRWFRDGSNNAAACPNSHHSPATTSMSFQKRYTIILLLLTGWLS